MLKREIRILGISAPTTVPRKSQSIPTVGVVYRGNLWLDGVFTCLLRPDDRDYLSTLARAIVQSKQYSQIRAAILSREQLIPGTRADITALAHRIKLPALAIAERTHARSARRREHKRSSKAARYMIKIQGKPVWVWASGLTQDRAREIFSLGCAEKHNVPEAVRVADLIARQIAGRAFFWQRAK